MSMSEFEIKFKVAAITRKDEEIGEWVAVCQPFDVWSQGKTKKESLENLKEALSMFLVSCFERGTLGEVLKDCGVSPSIGARAKARVKKTSAKTQNISVPIPFDVKQPIGPEPCPV